MVISCPECSTRFRVDDSKVPAQGAKIRCARCKHIFAVTPTSEPKHLVEDSLQPAENGLQVAEEPASTNGLVDTGDDFGFSDFDSSEIGSGASEDLDPSTFEDATAGDEDDDFSFGGDYGNVSLSAESDDESEDQPFSFGDPAPATTPLESARKQEQFGFRPAQPPAAETTDPLAYSFDEDPTLNDISMPPREEAFDLDEVESAVPQISKSSNRSSLSVILIFLLLLTLAVLIAGGVMIWKNGPAGVEQLISNLTGQPAVSELKGDIRLKDLRGSFITNRKEGELFVIQGIAVNNLSEAQAAIQVKGVIFDKSGKQLMQKTIFCGNPISDNDLRKLTYSKMEEMMGNQFGESLANLNVTQNQSIPFTIVFRKLPKTLSEFIVEVADSKPAAQ